MNRTNIKTNKTMIYASRVTSWVNVTISEGFSALVGTAMVALGVVLAFFAFFQYKKVENQINRQTYKSSSFISILLTLVIVVGGIFLVIHLLTGIII